MIIRHTSDEDRPLVLMHLISDGMNMHNLKVYYLSILIDNYLYKKLYKYFIYKNGCYIPHLIKL